VFEDVMKMICTTNCTWALTTVIVSNLVESFGEPFNAGHHTFPTAGAIAGSTERYLRTKIKAGYRAPYLLELSERVASGTLALEEWRNSPLDTPSLYREICSIKGVGPYAAQNLLRLLGRYEHLGLDSWVRAQHAKLHHGGRTVKDSTIERRYAPLGSWRGLFFWLEMTRHWHESNHQHSSR